MLNSEYLKNLNKSQKEAVMSLDGPLLIVAGAGSGKTKVLTSRIANIIKTKKAFPNQKYPNLYKQVPISKAVQAAKKQKESQDMLNDKDGDGMDDDQKPEKAKAKKMTDTGKPVTPIETSPKMPKTKNEKNKV